MFETSVDLRYFIVREKLINQRIIAGLVTLLFGGVIAAMVVHNDDRDSFFWLFGIFTSLIAIGSLVFLLTTPETTTTIDARERKVILVRRSLVSTKSEEFSFEDLAGAAYVETTKGTRGDVFAQILIPLRNGEPVPLTIEARYSPKRDLTPIAESINEIIFPHERPAFEVTIPDED